MTIATLALALFATACRSPRLPLPDPPPAAGDVPTVAPEERPPDPTPEPERVELPARTFVVVWKDAPLYQDPDEEAPVFRVLKRLDRRRPGDVYTYRAIARIGTGSGAWYELETITGVERFWHCHSPPALLGGASIRVFVQADQLGSVLVEAGRQEFDDDSAIDLVPGVHVVPAPASGGHGEDVGNSDGRTHLLGASDYGIPIELDADAVAMTYVTGERGHGILSRTERWNPFLDAGPRLGGRELVDQRVVPGPALERYCARVQLTHQSSTRGLQGNDGYLAPRLSLEGQGAEIRGDTQPDRAWLDSRCGMFSNCNSPERGPRKRDRVPGPPLTWPDGGVAGKALEDFPVRNVRDAPTRPDHVCFDLEGQDMYWDTRGNNGVVRLCAKARFVTTRVSSRLSRERESPSEIQRRGPIPRAFAASAVRSVRADLVRCTARLKRWKMSANWIVRSDGSVTRGTAGLGDEAKANACVQRVVETLDWPTGHTSTSVCAGSLDLWGEYGPD